MRDAETAGIMQNPRADSAEVCNRRASEGRHSSVYTRHLTLCFLLLLPLWNRAKHQALRWMLGIVQDGVYCVPRRVEYTQSLTRQVNSGRVPASLARTAPALVQSFLSASLPDMAATTSMSWSDQSYSSRVRAACVELSNGSLERG